MRAEAGTQPVQDLATRLTGVRSLPLANGTAIALSGNGRLVASHIEAVDELPARVFLDFEGVGMGSAPASTAVNRDDVRRVRVGVNSADPLITRVVIDLARKIPYTVQSVGEELRVLFGRNAPPRISDEVDRASDWLVGAAAGFASALTGTGGPMVLVPILVWRGTPLLTAIALGQIVQLPVAIVATVGNAVSGGVDLATGALVGVMLAPGVLLGRRAAEAMPLVIVARAIAVLLIGTGAWLALKAIM